LGKKITKTQVFTSQSRQALLHIFTRRSRSSLKHRSDLLVKTLHFIPLVKAFRYHSIALACHGVARKGEDGRLLFTEPSGSTSHLHAALAALHSIVITPCLRSRSLQSLHVTQVPLHKFRLVTAKSVTTKHPSK
jgi:hypothetical protein